MRGLLFKRKIKKRLPVPCALMQVKQMSKCEKCGRDMAALILPKDLPEEVKEILSRYCFQTYGGTWEQAGNDAQSAWDDIILYFIKKSH